MGYKEPHRLRGGMKWGRGRVPKVLGLEGGRTLEGCCLGRTLDAAAVKTRGWPCGVSAGDRRSGGPASVRGCHDDRRAGGGGCVEKRSALSLLAAPGSGGAGGNTGFIHLCLPRAGPGHGVPRPEPLGGRAGLGTAHRRPVLTGRAVPCLC